jgi:hypothetical protein
MTRRSHDASGGSANGLAANAITIVVEALRIGRQDLEQALAGDRTTLVERRGSHPVLSGSFGSSVGVQVGSATTA